MPELLHRDHNFFLPVVSRFLVAVRCNAVRYLIILILQYGLCAMPVSAQDVLSQRQHLRLYERGMELFVLGNYGGAIHQFKEYLKTPVADATRIADAQYYAGMCAVRLYQPEGEKQLELFAERNPTHPQATLATFELGKFFYQEKQYEKAATYFGRVNLTSLAAEQQLEMRFKWGYALFNLRKLKEANQQFAFVKNQGGQYGPAASYYAGFISYQEKDFSSALTDFKRAEQNSSYATLVPHLIAASLFYNRQYDDVIAYAKVVAGREDVSNAGEIQLFVAEAQFKKKNFSEAYTSYRAYLDDNAQADKAVFYRAGVAADESGKTKEAIGYLKTAALAPDTLGAFASYRLGALYLKAEQKPQALAAYEMAAKSSIDKTVKTESEFQVAKLLYDLGRPDEAIAMLDQYLLRNPQSVRVTEVKEILSQAYVNANNYNKAIEYIESLPRRGAAIDQAYQKATYLKATELFNQERYPEAIELFNKSMEYPVRKNLLAEAQYWCGEAYAIGRKYAESVPLYQKVIAAGADAELTANAQYALGYSFYNQQQYAQAIEHFGQVVNSDRVSTVRKTDATIRLADCHYIAKNYSEALALYRKAVSQKSADSDYAFLQSGIIFGIQRKYPEALAEFDKVLAGASRYRDDAWFNRGQINFEQGKYAAAVGEYARLIDQPNPGRFEPYALMRRAAANYNLKEFGKSSDDYIALIKKYPAHPASQDIVVQLQESLALANRANEFDQYLAAFKQANPDAKGIEGVEFEALKGVFFNQQYEKAIQSVKTFLVSYPESARATEARYYLAESYYRQKDYVNALAAFQETATDPSFNLLNRVYARMGELQFRAGSIAPAMSSYKKLERIAANKKDLYTAWSALMEANFRLGVFDSVSYYAQQIEERANVNAGAVNKAALYRGKALMGLGRYEEAKDEFVQTINAAQDENGAEAKYLLGEIFFLSKEHKRCFETLIDFNATYPAYTEWVGKSFLLLADNYLATGETFQAKATLQSLAESFPLEPIKAQARQKLLGLNTKLEPASADTLNRK
jgi:tetratricopeptide (TPR) repeat protein